LEDRLALGLAQKQLPIFMHRCSLPGGVARGLQWVDNDCALGALALKLSGFCNNGVKIDFHAKLLLRSNRNAFIRSVSNESKDYL
jgi:hypothetical protein